VAGVCESAAGHDDAGANDKKRSMQNAQLPSFKLKGGNTIQTCTVICLKVEPFCKALHKQPHPKLTRHFVSSPLALEGEPAVSRHTVSHPTRTFHRPRAFSLNVPGTSRQSGLSRPADHAARHRRAFDHADRERQRHVGRICAQRGV